MADKAQKAGTVSDADERKERICIAKYIKRSFAIDETLGRLLLTFGAA
jgi:hypothetical protein